ncbi:MAG TPA: bifunctional chorismate mutase/prephenate dehydrogenase [Gemmatimonadaceae bacterium]
MSTDPNARPLPLLRAMVDSLDHELLQLAARRMAVVSEIAAYKRQHHIRIRDPQREREILEDRARRAEEMGLPKGEIEAMFRVLLRASRDHQAALRTELPYETPSLTVAVVGGRGAMGALLARMFGDLGHSVLVTDHETDLTPGDAAEVADVTVISVPIDATAAVIREVGPRLRPDSLLMDVTSVKSEPMREMLDATRAGVVGTHPMFGPSVHSLQGQRVVVCRGRGDHWAEWVSSMFTARGLAVVEATPEHHDRMMATVQVLTHFQTQVHGLTLARLGSPLSESLRFTSPAYLMELYMGGRHFAQSADLYGPIEMKNPATPAVTATYLAVANEVAGILASGDRERFREMFAEVKSFLGPFTVEALEQTSFLIDRLVERT